jgi:hypothetical protein
MHIEEEVDEEEMSDRSPACCFWESLPFVFGFLEAPYLSNAAMVCRQWALVVRSVTMERGRQFLHDLPELRERLMMPLSDIEDHFTRADVLTLRQLLRVPRQVQLVGEAVVSLLRPRQNASFGAFRNLIADPQFFDLIRKFDPSTVNELPERALCRLHYRVVDPMFQPDQVAEACPAATGLCMWVLSMYSQVPLHQLEMKAIRLQHYLRLAEEATHAPVAPGVDSGHKEAAPETDPFQPIQSPSRIAQMATETLNQISNFEERGIE